MASMVPFFVYFGLVDFDIGSTMWRALATAAASGSARSWLSEMMLIFIILYAFQNR